MPEETDRYPVPLEWHPAYRGKTWLMDWLDGLYPDSSSRQIRVLFFPAVRYVDSDPVLADVPPIRVLRREKCWGIAPYVGHPFVYEWQVGVDDLGRAIAADSIRMYDPSWLCRLPDCGCREPAVRED